MKKILYPIALSIIGIVLLTTCKKKETGPQLPPETQTGAFTLGFKIDGKIYFAEGKPPGTLRFSHVWGYGPRDYDSAIYIYAVNSGENKFDLSLNVKYKGSLGIVYTTDYPFDAEFTDRTNGSLQGNSNLYKTKPNTHTAKVNIKRIQTFSDPLSLAGTFEMDCVNAEGKTIKLTDGRFDVGKY